MASFETPRPGPRLAPASKPASARAAVESRFLAREMRLAAELQSAPKGRGRSPLAQAWQRLWSQRTARWSLVFLLAFGLLSALAPLLPLPSPTAIDLRSEPAPPVWPFASNPRLQAGPDSRPLPLGRAPTQSLWSFADNGWQHRALVELELEGSPAEGARAALEALARSLAALEQRPVEHFLEPGQDPSTSHGVLALPLLEHCPLWGDDLAQSGAPDTGLEARLQRGLTAELSRHKARVLSVSLVSGTWPLMGFDRWLMGLRAKLFGLWQSGPWLGTDNKGRDLFARILWGSRISIQVSLVAALCSLLIGVTYGAVAGLAGRRIDNGMMRFVDLLYAVPFIFIVIFLITVLNEYRSELERFGIGRLTVFYAVLGAVSWLTMARIVRGQVLSLKHQEFIAALESLGASKTRVLLAHVLPNVAPIVVVYLTLTVPSVMLFEAFLSFLGLGVEPPQVSWGLLALDGSEAISPIKVFWWTIAFPAAAMGSTLLALNLLGDALRDALDPKHVGGS